MKRQRASNSPMGALLAAQGLAAAQTETRPAAGTWRHRQATLFGPLVLVGDLGAEGLTENQISGPNPPAGYRTWSTTGRPCPVRSDAAGAGSTKFLFCATPREPAWWIKPGSSRWRFGLWNREKIWI